MPAPEPPPWFAELQRPPSRIPARAARPAPLLLDDTHEAITSVAAWSARRDVLRRRWLEYLGEIPRPAQPPRWTVLETDDRDGVRRELIRYESEPGLPVEAYRLRPLEDAPTRPHGRPGVVVLHSTVDYTIRQPAGLEGPPEKHIALHLARRGYETIAPRCFLWQRGDNGKIAGAVDWLTRRHPAVKGMAKMLYDARRALDLLASFPGVDPNRLGTIGHSLGAKEALYLAGFDERVRATVSSEGGIGLGDSNWDAPWYLGGAIHQPGFPLNHAQVLALAAPRAFLLIGGDSADGDASWPTVEAALPVWRLLNAGNAVGLHNHRQGHSFPDEASKRSYEWLDWFLRT